MPDESRESLPPLPVRVIGRWSSAAIARAPWMWPVLRRPTQAFWQRTASAWDDRINPDSDEHLAPLTAACERLADAPRSALELGTGTGAGALMLARRFPDAEVHAVDLSPAMIELAKAKLPDDVRVQFGVADAAALPFAAEAFDLVCQLNLPLFAAEIARVLRPGGHVVIASSRGPQTPYYTPDAVLRRSFEGLGLEVLAGGSAGASTYFLARRPL